MKNRSKKIFGSKDRPRITVFASLMNISAQMIDDNEGRTLVSASTLEKEMRHPGNAELILNGQKDRRSSREKKRWPRA